MITRHAGIPNGPDDGTLAPWEVVASLPFAPEIVLPSLNHFNQEFPEMTSKYGFKCSYNPTFTYTDRNKSGWVSLGYYGLDQGPIVVMIENYRTGFLWRLMRNCPYIVLDKNRFYTSRLRSIRAGASGRPPNGYEVLSSPGASAANALLGRRSVRCRSGTPGGRRSRRRNGRSSRRRSRHGNRRRNVNVFILRSAAEDSIPEHEQQNGQHYDQENNQYSNNACATTTPILGHNLIPL